MTHDEWRHAEPLASQVLGLSADEQRALVESANLSDPIRFELLAALQRLRQSSSVAVAPTPTPRPLADSGPGQPPAPPLPVLAAGISLDEGRYVVIRQIGRGGMGTVFLAHDTKLGMLVALKVTPHNERVLAEARRAAACSGHPHVAAIHDVFEAHVDGLAVGVLVMEFVDGTPASRLLDDGPVDVRRALRWARQVAAAIGHAHDHQVLHCDLKPANIMITPDGRAKVLDFGISRGTFDPADASEPVRGTLPYMAPEQLLAKEFSAAGDIYSLGVTLFELVTGRLPFEGDDAALRLRIVVAPPPSVMDLVPAVPPQLHSVIERALAKEPQRRYRSARSFERALDSVEAGADDTTATVPVPAPAPPVPDPIGLIAKIGIGVGSLFVLFTLLGFLTSRALDSGLGRTTEFRVESPLWWPIWGAMTLTAPLVGVVAPILIGAVIVAAAATFFMNTHLGTELLDRYGDSSQAWLERIARCSSGAVCQGLVLAQIATLAFILWQFSDLIAAILAFMDPKSTAPLYPLRPSNSDAYGLLRLSLSIQLVLFLFAWVTLVRRGVADAAIPLAAAGAVTLVTLFFFAVPFRILNHNEHRRVSFHDETCYVAAEKGTDVLLFCPRAPRTRIIDATNPGLRRSSEVEDIFSEYDRSPATSSS